MKKLVLFLLVVTATTGLFAQKDTSNNYVKSFEHIPSISVHIAPDSSLFSNKDIKKNLPFIVMFFSPECEHCQRETKELLAYKQELKGIQILMISYMPYKEIKDFYDSYGVSAMPNIKMGQDQSMKLGVLYKVRTFPTMFVYDKRGVLAKTFSGNIGIPVILEAVK